MMNEIIRPTKLLFVTLEDEDGNIEAKQRYEEFTNSETRDISIVTSLKGPKLFECLMELKHVSSKNGKFQFNFIDPFPFKEDVAACMLMGKVAELIILKRCASVKLNRKYAKIARNGKIESAWPDNYLPVTATKLNGLNTNDKQIDIFWVKKSQNDEDESKKSFLLNLDKDHYAGLQVKFSKDGLNYVLPFLKDKKYNVPMMYFGVKSDYEKIRTDFYEYIESNDEFKIKKKEIGEYISGRFVDMKSFDLDAFEEAEDYYPLIKKLVKGKMKIDDLLDGKKIIKQSLTNYIFDSNAELIQKAVHVLKQ